MNDLMTKIVKKIQDRQKQVHQVTYSENNIAPDTQVFVDCANVDVMTVSLKFIKDLYELNQSNTWVSWVMKGLEYDVKFRFEVSDKVSRFVPNRMIIDWPLLFVVDAKHPMYTSRSKLISRADLADFADNAILAVTKEQRLTSEALDLANGKGIQLQVRNDAECIWQR